MTPDQISAIAEPLAAVLIMGMFLGFFAFLVYVAMRVKNK